MNSAPPASKRRLLPSQGLRSAAKQIVSIDHRGLLQIREVPAENEDRILLTRLRSEQSETGEWIEIPGTTPGSFELKRRDAKTTPPASQPTTTNPPIPTTPKP